MLAGFTSCRLTCNFPPLPRPRGSSTLPGSVVRRPQSHARTSISGHVKWSRGQEVAAQCMLPSTTFSGRGKPSYTIFAAILRGYTKVSRSSHLRDAHVTGRAASSGRGHTGKKEGCPNDRLHPSTRGRNDQRPSAWTGRAEPAPAIQGTTPCSRLRFPVHRVDSSPCPASDSFNN